MSKQLNIEQQLAVSDRSGNILVSASAGSGKTTVLIERIGGIMLDDQVPIDQIMALTFTDNAATEMRQRLAVFLQNSLKDTLDPLRQLFIREQLAKLPEALITTIHSFCLQVVQKYYPVIGLMAQDVTNILSEIECQLYRAQAMELVFEKYYQDQRFIALQSATSSRVGDLKPLSKFVVDIANALRQVEDQSLFISQQQQRYNNISLLNDDGFNKIMQSWLREQSITLANLRQLFESEKENNKDLLCLMYVYYLQVKEAYIRNDFRSMWDALRSYLQVERPGRLKVGKFEMGQLKKTDLTISQWCYDWDLYANNQAVVADQLELLMLMAVDYQVAYTQLKRGLGIDFDDMEQYCVAILRNQEIAEVYSHHLRHVFIDEFQDTSRLQDEIISHVVNKDNVFRVGDIKQSIYAFRNAEPKIFLNYLQQTDQKVIRLTTNYRSSLQIVEGVNQMFNRLFNIEQLTPLYNREDFVNAGNQKLHKQPPIKVVFLRNEEPEPADSEEENAIFEEVETHDEDDNLSGIEQKATYIINTIQQLVNDNINPKQYRDIVILVRGAFHNQVFERLFSEAKIPIKVSVKENLNRSPKLNGILAALSWVVQPLDDVALVTILKNFCGWSDQDLTKLYPRNKSSVLQWLQSFDLTTYQTLTELKRLTLSSSLVDALEIWLNFNGFGVDIITKVEYHNLNLLRSLALDYQIKVGTSLSHFVQFALDWQSNGDKGEAVIYDQQENVVRVETMHASKGKEYDVVFIWGKQRFTDHDLNKFGCVDSNFGISWRGMMDSQTSLHNFIAYDVERQMLRKQREEEIRILYVAMTRAQSQLFYVDNIGKKDFEADLDYHFMLTSAGYTKWLQLLSQQMGNNEHIMFETLSPPKIFTKVTVPSQKQKAFNGKFITNTTKLNSPSFHDQPLVWDDVAATTFGTTKHEAIHQALTNKTIPDDPYLLPLFDDKQFTSWLTFPHQSEMDYYQLINDQIIHGIMDLVVELPDQYVIIDFKTDQVNHVDDLALAYHDQLNQYREALALTTKKPIATWIYSLKLHQWVLIN